MIWLDLVESKKVPRVGSIVRVSIGGKKFRGKVLKGPGKSRYGRYRRRLKKIILEQKVGEKLSRSQIRRLHKKAVRWEGA